MSNFNTDLRQTARQQALSWRLNAELNSCGVTRRPVNTRLINISKQAVGQQAAVTGSGQQLGHVASRAFVYVSMRMFLMRVYRQNEE